MVRLRAGTLHMMLPRPVSSVVCNLNRHPHGRSLHSLLPVNLPIRRGQTDSKRRLSKRLNAAKGKKPARRPPFAN